MYYMEDEYSLLETDDEYESENNNTLYTFYKIIPKNKEMKCCYVGHTTNFTNRIRQHKVQTENDNYNKSHYKLYQTIRQNGGWDEWEMVELEKFQASSKLEARMKEQEFIDKYGANLNSLKAYISEEDRTALKKQITQKYREDNKELLREQTKKYKAEHKEIIAEQMKKYRAEHKKEIYEKAKEYKEKNSEKHKEWNKAWREKNKEILKEKRKIYEAKKKQQKLEQQQQKALENA